MVLSSPINDRYFHECFSQPIVSKFVISSCSATNFAENVEHLLQCETCSIYNGTVIVLEIFTHECRGFHRHSHKHSPNNRMFFSFSCNVGNSFLSFSHMIIHPIHEWSWFYRQFQFCFVASHDEILWICHFLRIDIIRSPWSITKCFSVPYRLRGSVEKNFFVIRLLFAPLS